MSLEMLHGSALSAIEVLINQALALDSLSKKKLLKLQDKVIVIACKNPGLFISVSIHEAGVSLSPFNDETADARISGTATALASLLLAEDIKQAMREKEIQIQGDAGVMQDLQEILTDLNIDWEFQLSKILGDVPTQLLSDGLKQFQRFIKTSHARMTANLDEFLHEESRLFPGKYELETFYQRVDELRLRIDRLKLRLTKLEINQ